MQELYNCKQIDKTHYRITKFDKHLNPKYNHKGEQSSYTVSDSGCDCPQGHKPNCRHQKIKALFIERGYVDTEYFYVWDMRQWYKAPALFVEARKANGKTAPPPPSDMLPNTPPVPGRASTGTYRRF